MPDDDRADGVARCGTIDSSAVVHEQGDNYILTLFAADGDANEDPTHSQVVLYEDGRALGPAHSSHADIRTLGGGRFSHWHQGLYFSSSDHSSPISNARTYGYGVDHGACPIVMCGQLDLSRVNPETGLAYISSQYTGLKGDTTTEPTVSPLHLYESGVEMGPPHSQHADIRSLGAGRFSKWGSSLYFSSSDGSDPRNNGRAYTYGADRCNAIQLTRVDTAQTGYATFQSHNQKVVANANGIFMTYLHTGGDGIAPATWRLAWSRDGGGSFQTLYQTASMQTKAPAIETDSNGNLYLAHADWNGANGHFYVFDASTGYSAAPTVIDVPGFGPVGKYSMILDEAAQYAYFASWTGIARIDLTTHEVTTQTLLTSGPHADPQYPLLALSPDGLLFYGWTSVSGQAERDAGWGTYYSNHFIASGNHAQSWAIPGLNITTPIAADETGPGVLLTSADDLAAVRASASWSNWTNNMLFKDGKLHVMYYSGAGVRYVRYAMGAPFYGIDRFMPLLGGQSLSLWGLGGFFASSAGAGAPLYAISNDQSGRVNVLSSLDDGASWQDFATTEDANAFSVYALGGARAVTRDGFVMGSFVDSNTLDVFFLKVNVRP